MIIEILKSIEGTKEEDLDMSVAHSNQNCLPPGGRDAHNHGLPCQDEIGILVAKKRKAGDMVDPAATLLTRKAEQWHPAKQLCDRSKVAIPLKKKLEMSKTENRAPNLVRAGEWHISNKTPVPVEHHSVAAGEREYSTVKTTTPISLTRTLPGERLEMLLEKAAAESARLVSGGTNPRDGRHEQLQQEMGLMERNFSHCLKELEMRDRRVLQLEGQLEGAKEQNNLLRAQLDGLSMKSTAPTYTMGASPGQRVWRELLPPAGTAIRMPHTQVGPPYPSAFPTSPETQAVIFKCCGTVSMRRRLPC